MTGKIAAIFNLPLGGPHRTLTVGKWTRNESFVVPQPNIYERRKDLSGVTLINSVLPWEPVMIFEEYDNGTQKLDGFMYKLYKILQGASEEEMPELSRRYYFVISFLHRFWVSKLSGLCPKTDNGVPKMRTALGTASWAISRGAQSPKVKGSWG